MSEIPLFARRLREARREGGLSVTNAAKQAGCSRTHLTSLESGSSEPSLALAARLSAVYNKSIDWLAGTDDDCRSADVEEVDRIFERSKPVQHLGPGLEQYVVDFVSLRQLARAINPSGAGPCIVEVSGRRLIAASVLMPASDGLRVVTAADGELIDRIIARAVERLSST